MVRYVKVKATEMCPPSWQAAIEEAISLTFQGFQKAVFCMPSIVLSFCCYLAVSSHESSSHPLS